MAMDGVELTFTDEALESIVEEAHKRKTGARALRAIVEELMLDVMYEAPSHAELTKCNVDKEWLEHHGKGGNIFKLMAENKKKPPVQQDEIA